MEISLTPDLHEPKETHSAEWALLVECAKPRANPKRLATCLGKPLDWSALIALAEDHGTLGVIAARLRAYDETAIPFEPRETIRQWLRNQALFTLNLTAEMLRLFAAFAASNLEALVIKGPVLSMRSYGDPGLRQYGDLDLIVRDRDILQATELMMALDYAPRIPIAAIRANKIPGEYVFRHSRNQLLVEFHTEKTFRYHPLPIPIESLFGRSVQEAFDGIAIPSLCPADELVLICIHGAKHFWERLVYVADVAAFVSRQQLDWDRVSVAAQEVGAQKMLDAGLRLALDLLEAPLPERIAVALRSDRSLARLSQQIARWLPAAGSAPPGIVERAMFRIRMRGGIFSGVPYLVRLSLSPTEEDWIRGGQEKRHWLVDAMGRPLRLARKYGRDGKP